MKIAGIVAEYNPFHNGHARHILETRRRTGCDYVIVCMDGHFTQRGEPAIFSKWARSRMALSCGADAVLELPALFAVRTADAFARGGVEILAGLGADVLSFGCETEDNPLLEKLAEIHKKEPTSVCIATKERLAAGMSHARARGEAIADYLGMPCEAINHPNLILATEYICAIQDCASSMEICAVKRTGDYHGEALGPDASAAAIRAALGRGDTEAALACIPDDARRFAEMAPMHPMDDMLLLRLRDMSLEALRSLPHVSEGLEHRLYRCCRETSTRATLLEAMKCKRYTHARLSRLLTHALLGVTQDMLTAHPAPTYARLLGARRGSEPLLNELKRRSRLPVAASPKALIGDPVFQLECRATDIWALLHDRPEARLPGREFTEAFIRI